MLLNPIELIFSQCCMGCRSLFFQELANLILDPLVLHIFRMYRADLFPLRNLHAAFRCYILWEYGQLRVGDRRVIPSCVVSKIRDRYPDPYNNYRGFARVRFG